MRMAFILGAMKSGERIRIGYGTSASTGTLLDVPNGNGNFMGIRKRWVAHTHADTWPYLFRYHCWRL